jgi:NAD(P)-dependent dehydrogenase (short-subunit alcohol dehydrogenase family)
MFLPLIPSGHFVLTKLLMKTMVETAKKTGKQGRIVNVSSAIHNWFTGDVISYLSLICRNKLRSQHNYYYYCIYLINFNLCWFTENLTELQRHDTNTYNYSTLNYVIFFQIIINVFVSLSVSVCRIRYLYLCSYFIYLASAW